MKRVEDRLRELRAPGEEDAERRALDLVSASLEERSAPAAPEPRRFTAPRRAAFVAAATVALLVGAVTPTGSAVADWLGDAVKSVVDDDPPPRRASGLDELPGGGRVLVLATPREGGPLASWIAGEGDHRRLLGAVEGATWSPHARFVAAARDSELFAVDREGRRRWSVAAPGDVHALRWSPDGFRVAYTAGSELRVVAGDGTGDRRVAGMRPGEPSGFGAFEWRPGPGHVLAFDKRRSLFLADLDRRRVLWRVSVADDPRIAFAPAGDRLLLAGARQVRVLRARDGRTLQRLTAAPGRNLADAAWDRAGRRIAVVRKTATRAELLVGRPRGRTIRLRRLFAAGELNLVGFSPDNRWLLVDWTESDAWLFLPVDGGRPRQLTGVRRRFGAADVIPVGWCCPP